MINLNSMESDKLELMDQFFDSRVDNYDIIHQQTGISWGKQIRDIVSSHIPEKKVKILDLGCGTGLELDELFKKSPNSEVVCVDLSQEMLKKLVEKYNNYNIKVINGNFLDMEFGYYTYDYVISVMALHHFFEKEKLLLYKKIYNSLKKGGLFINSDYIIDDSNFELECFKKLKQIQSEYPGKLFHFDVPFTEYRERRVLLDSGFSQIDKVYENKKAKILVNKK